MRPQRWTAAGGCGGSGGYRAFTLIEVLVVVAMIAVLIAIMLPALAKSRAAARNATCLARLHDLSLATVVYAHDYHIVPLWGTLGPVPMLREPPICWRCPSDKYFQPGPEASSYTYLGLLYMGPNADLASPATLNPQLALLHYEDNPQLPLFRDSLERHPHRNVAFWDGVARKWWDD